MGAQSPFLEIPASQWIASNELAFAAWDRFPVSPGHALVIPKRMVAEWWDASTEEQHALLALADDVRREIERTHRPDGWNIGVNVGAAGGQTVDHLHLHVIPRYAGDTPDPRGGIRHAMPGKGNWLASATPQLGAETPGSYLPSVRLFDGVARPLGPELDRLLIDERYDRLDVAVAFVTAPGVERIAGSLADGLERGLRLRFLTSDYLDFTDPAALHRLLALTETGAADLRIMATTGGRGFHAKAYLFSASDGSSAACLVGSSNLTVAALDHNQEWNVEVDRLSAFAERFEDIWAQGEQLDADWVRAYARRRTPPLSSGKRPTEIVDPEPEPPPAPTEVQREALAALEQSREAGHTSGLVVMATGLGKTWLAGFDSRDVERVLFIAHREEILRQAQEVFIRVRPDRRTGLAVGGDVDLSADVLFASVQWLHHNLTSIRADRFDDIIVDEFHHAAARSYRRVLAHLEPQRFLLGLTATPERMDGADLLALTGDNLVFDCGLVEGIERGLLSTFQYRGVADEHVDYQRIRWRGGRFVEKDLTAAVVSDARIQQVWEEWEVHGRSPALGFCASIDHADAMASVFSRLGARAVAVHTGPASAPRRRSIRDLAEGHLDIVFAVDLFNEGLDVPRIATVLLLRPTESPVVFMQQLGRGLRRYPGKEHLQIIDFLGNHRSFLDRLRLLVAAFGDGAEPSPSEAMRLFGSEDDRSWLPEGCAVEVDLTAIALLEQLRTKRSALEDFIRERSEERGARPSAAQCHAAGLNPESAKPSWFAWLADRDLLDAEERDAVRGASRLLHAVQKEQITKSFKLLVLRAMLNGERLWAGASLAELAEDVRQQLTGDPRLSAETAEPSVPDPATAPTEAWLAYMRKNPFAAWSGEMRSDPSTAPFEVLDERFQLRRRVPAEHREAVLDLLGELVDWRLLRYLDGKSARSSDDGDVAIIGVKQNSSGNPILLPLPRDRYSWLPTGEREVDVDGRTLLLRFMKVAVNVAKDPGGDDRNVLPDLLREWFGSDAGAPGTLHRVELRAHPRLRLRPLDTSASAIGAGGVSEDS